MGQHQQFTKEFKLEAVRLLKQSGRPAAGGRYGDRFIFEVAGLVASALPERPALSCGAEMVWTSRSPRRIAVCLSRSQPSFTG